MNPRLKPENTALILVDWQEKLYAVMAEGERERARGYATELLWLARERAMPVLATEQYPRGLGATLPELAVDGTLEKLHFSAVAAEGFTALLDLALPPGGPRNALITGMETHICVAQTARDLVDLGVQVWVVADACLSRRPHDAAWGLERLRADGARVVTAEAALYELVGQAGTPLFKELSRRLRQR